MRHERKRPTRATTSDTQPKRPAPDERYQKKTKHSVSVKLARNCPTNYVGFDNSSIYIGGIKCLEEDRSLIEGRTTSTDDSAVSRDSSRTTHGWSAILKPDSPKLSRGWTL